MCNIKIHRYGPQALAILNGSEYSLSEFWQGYIEPEDQSWIAFIDGSGLPTFFLNRDPRTGAVL